MDKHELVEKIENCNSKVSALIITDLVVKQPKFIDILFEMMFKYENKKHWKAAWILDHVYTSKSELVNPYINQLISLFTQTSSSSIQRIAGKILSFHDINANVDGIFINNCVDMIISETVPVAVKVHAMQLIYNISTLYPELKVELKLIIEEHIPNNTVGFKSRAKKLLKSL